MLLLAGFQHCMSPLLPLGGGVGVVRCELGRRASRAPRAPAEASPRPVLPQLYRNLWGAVLQQPRVLERPSWWPEFAAGKPAAGGASSKL